MKRTVYLHGRLKKVFGEKFEFEIATAGEAFRALHFNFPKTFIEELKIGSYRIIRGRRHGGMELELDHLNTFNLGAADLHIVPVVEGAKSGSGKGGGVLKAVLGVAIIGAAIFFSGGTLAAPLAGMAGSAFSIGGMSISWGTIAAFGLAMTLSGVSQMISPKDKPAAEQAKSDSFSFSGPSNTNEQGNPIPLIYGEVITGSQVISAGIDIEDIPVG